MKAVFKTAIPYADDALNLPVPNLDAAIPYYQQTLGFEVISRQERPHRSAILARGSIRIGLAENGGDPTQEGCFFEVDDVGAAFQEIRGRPASEGDVNLEVVSGTPYHAFFTVAPDGL